MASPDPIRIDRTSRDSQDTDPGIPSLANLDFEEEEPTRVMESEAYAPAPGRAATIIPPRIDDGDVYMLTRQHLRYKAGVLPLPEEHVDLQELLNTPSSPPAALAESHETPSLAPVAMDPGEHSLSGPPALISTRRGPHAAYPMTLGALALTAIALVLIPVPRSAEVPAPQAPVAAAPSDGLVANEPHHAVELEPVVVMGAIHVLPAVVIASAAGPLANAQSTPDPGVRPAPVAQELEPPAAAAPAEAPAFDRSAAHAALAAANRAAAHCREQGSPNFPFNVTVTFAPSGAAMHATVDGPPYAGTPAGGCIARIFRTARLTPFSGPAVTVHKVFQLP